MAALFTVNKNDQYNIDSLIENYESYIWTERFIEAGDLTLVLPASYENAKLVKPGSVIGTDASRELMLIETRSLEDGKITYTGKTLESGIFSERYIGVPGRSSRLVSTLGSARRQLWHLCALNNRPYRRTSGGELVDYDGAGLQIEWVSDTETYIDRETYPYGNQYETMLLHANKYQIGMGVYRYQNDDGGYDIIFKTRFGDDQTDEILFSPQLDNLANVKELISDVDYKNVVIAWPPKDMSTPDSAWFLWQEPVVVTNVDDDLRNSDFFFNDRILEITNEDITLEDFSNSLSDAEKAIELIQILKMRATQHLRAHKKTKVIDGELTSESQYRYHTEPNPGGLTEYKLGDHVQIGGEFSPTTTGFISEYIRSVDTSGSRAYPTIASLPNPEVEYEES